MLTITTLLYKTVSLDFETILPVNNAYNKVLILIHWSTKKGHHVLFITKWNGRIAKNFPYLLFNYI